MKAKYLILCLVVFALAAAVHAQTPAPAPTNEAAPPSAPAQLSEADLEKLVAPIALYPDPLLATLLPASAYPLDIVKAARFIKDTNNIPKVDSQPWDSNVKALAHFPDVLNKMNDDIDWTSDLGDAFVNDQKSVMNAIQVMRNKAHDQGNLKTSPQQTVTVTNTVVQETVNQQVVVMTNTIVQIQPASPQVIYVPQYNPAVVYYAPAPPMAYVAPFVSFGAGMMWGAAIANNCNWHSGDVNINHNFNRNVNVNNNARVNRNWNNNTVQANRNANNRNFGQNGSQNRANTGNQANRNPGQNAGRSGGALNNGNNRGANTGGQKWQSDPNRRSSGTGASQDSRGWGNSGNTGRGDAFSNYGGGSGTRAASQRGSASSGNRSFSGGASGGRSGGGFRGGGGGGRGGGGRR